MRDRLALIWAAILGRPICHKMHVQGTVTVSDPGAVLLSSVVTYASPPEKVSVMVNG